MNLKENIRRILREELNNSGKNDLLINTKKRLVDYIENIDMFDDDDGIIYSGTYGGSGSLTWVKNGDVITVHTIDSGDQKDSSGTKAVASLFLSNPNVKTITYQDHSHFDDNTSFWERIGGDYTDLEREDFFNYFEKKYKYNPDL